MCTGTAQQKVMFCNSLLVHPVLDLLDWTVYGPTHKYGHVLDLVFTRYDDTFSHDCYTDDKLMSDHHIICFALDILKPAPQCVTSTLRDYQKINHDDFSKSTSEFTSNFLLNANADYDTCSNSLFECYNTGLKNILHSPSTTQTRTIKTRMPWYNDTFHMARRSRRQAERKWPKTRSVDDRELYLAAKQNVCDLTISAKEAYFKDKLSSCNSKHAYRIIGTLLNENVQHLPFYDSACNLSKKKKSVTGQEWI